MSHPVTRRTFMGAAGTGVLTALGQANLSSAAADDHQSPLNVGAEDNMKK